MKRLVKNNLLCLLILTFLGVNNSAAQSLSTYNLTGKVKKMREYHYRPLDGCDYCEDLQNDSTIVEFNENGKIVREIECLDSPFDKTVIKDVYNYKYDGNGRLIEKKHTSESNIYTDKYYRDSQGYIIRIEEYSKYTDDYYNSLKSILEENKLKLSHVEYRQNWEDGTAKEISNYNCDGTNKTLSNRKKFDKNGWLLKTIYNDSSEDTHTREFHANGNVAKRISVLSDGRKEVVIYNEKGLLTAYTAYNKNGNVSKTQSCTYKYDSHGNWISYKVITTFHNTGYISTDIYKRKITYYK